MINQTFSLRGNDRNTLAVYITDPVRDGQRKPLFISCPGGGWLDCSPNEGEPVAMHFVRQGYHGAVLTYTRAASSDQPSWPNALYDLAEGVRIIRAHADEWGVGKIVICGFSAGGQLVTAYGNEWAGELFEGYDEDPEVRRVDAVVAGYPAVDYRSFGDTIRELEQRAATSSIDMGQVTGESNKSLDLLAFVKMCNHGFVGDAELTPEFERRVSSLANVNAQTPPTFVWTTFGDSILNANQDLEYARALHDAGIPCELHIFMEGDHGLSLADRSCAKKDAYIDSHVAQWATLATEWLDLVLAD